MSEHAETPDRGWIKDDTAPHAALARLFRAGMHGSALMPQLQIDLAFDLWRHARRRAQAIARRYASENEATQRRFARVARQLLLAKRAESATNDVSASSRRRRTGPGSGLETLTLPRGEAVDLRAMTPADGKALALMLTRTTSEDRRLRFLSSGIAITETLIAQLTGYDRTRALALCAFLPGTQELIAVARLHRDQGPATGEFAVLVRSDWHGHGLGHALLERIIVAARQRGMTELWGHVLAENLTMLRMCQNLGFSRDAKRSTAGLHVMVLDLCEPATQPEHAS